MGSRILAKFSSERLALQLDHKIEKETQEQPEANYSFLVHFEQSSKLWVC
jgi:hypothetical protein